MEPIKKISDLTKSDQPILKNLRKGTVLLDPEAEIKHVWFLRKGYIRQYLVSANGDDVTVHIFRPGAVLPLMLYAADLPNRFYFQAATNIEVQEFPAKKILETVQDNPKLLFELTAKFALAINALTLRIEMLSTKTSRTKTLLFLEYLRNHFATEKNGKSKIALPLTHAEIAAWIGTKRETVSREFSILAKKGVISVKKGFITINNKEGLLEEGKRLP